MKSIETLASFTADGTLTAKIPPIIFPGEHQVIIVINEQRQAQDNGDAFAGQEETDKQLPPNREPLRFSAYQVGLIADDFTFRREDLYDDHV